MKIKNRLIGLALPFCNASPNLKRRNKKWVGLPLILSIALYGAILGSCGQIKHLPTETTTEIHYVDSVRYEIRDSIRIIERSRWKDYGGLLDTLRIRGNRSEMKAWTDTTNNILNGSLEEDPQEEKQRIIYRDRWKTKDSLVYVEKPVPVEVTKEVIKVPWIYKVLSAVGLLSILGIALWALWKKLRNKGLLVGLFPHTFGG